MNHGRLQNLLTKIFFSLVAIIWIVNVVRPGPLLLETCRSLAQCLFEAYSRGLQRFSSRDGNCVCSTILSARCLSR